ncbi:MAG TPA: RecX family transcriptional regulator [Tissierellaceae bacterium]|nr:RecX family transcriptional regulator [Tissierellaceae bacterium]
MKITKIEAQKRKGRVNIYVNDDFALGIDEEIMIKYNLKEDMKIDDDFMENILLAEEENKALNYALRLLSYRQRSEKEISDALKRKGYMNKHIENVIASCLDKNYLNDKDFARSFTNDKINLNKYGPERIKHELLLKGVSKTIIDEVVDYDRDEQYELAKEVANKKINSYKNDKKRDIYRKMSGFLQRRGFSYDIISKVVREILNEIDEKEELND